MGGTTGGVRRGRVAVVAASVALAGAMGAGVVYAGPFDGRSEVAAAAVPEAEAERRVVSILRGLLPEGKAREVPGDGGGATLGAYAKGAVVLDDGAGPALVSVALGRTDSPALDLVALAGCPDGPGGVGRWGPKGTCTKRVLSDGSGLLLVQDRVAPYGERDAAVWSARLIRPDGSMLTATELNAPATEGAAPTREEPPLSQERLTELVTAEEWRTLLDSFPRRGGGEVEPGAPSGFELLDTLEPLLPPGLRYFGRAGGTSPTHFAHLRVDDGKGGAAVEVTVDHRGTNDSEEPRVEERNGPAPWSGEGVLHRSVTVTRPGGFRVTVTAYNTSRPLVAEPARGTPPLSVERLREIAGSGTWDRFR
ncbi:hypothetical protein [Streptomyces thermolilacinus]|uniref:hypothetical protein n=1 Tax=Streptomyces thermolilacinus TaxID=285540 RepID=UPI0033DA7E37